MANIDEVTLRTLHKENTGCGTLPPAWSVALVRGSNRIHVSVGAHKDDDLLHGTLFLRALILDHQNPPSMNHPVDHDRPEAFVLAGKDIQRKPLTIGASSTEDRALCNFLAHQLSSRQLFVEVFGCK